MSPVAIFQRMTGVFSYNWNIFKKVLAIRFNIVYNGNCCDMIAKKREVAIPWMGFPWSECQETATNDFAVGKPDDKSLYVA